MRSLASVVCAVLLVGCGGSTVDPASSGGDLSAADAAADASAEAARDAGFDGEPSCCVGQAVRWGYEGGFVAWTATSAIAPCRAYTYERVGAGMPADPITCTQDLAACGAGGIDVAQLAVALGHADVVGALAATTALYGSDPRPCDGAVLRITVGARAFDVGGECTPSGGCGLPADNCVPVAPGVRALADLLLALQTEQLARGACACDAGSGLCN